MSQSPSHTSTSSGYSRSNSHRYHSPLSVHHSPQQFPHPSSGRHSYPRNNPPSPTHSSVEHDPYHRPHPEDQHYYPYPRHPSPEYHHRRPPLPPPPHPPAPPAPPRPHSYHKSYRQSPAAASPRSNLVPTFGYYRGHVEYDAQNGSPHVDTERPLSDSRRDDARPRSASLASGDGSIMHEHVEAEVEATPSPVDPKSIQQWDEEHANGESQHTSSASGSYRGEEEEECETGHASASNGVCPPPKGQTTSSVDDGRRVGGVDPGSAGLQMLCSQKRPNSEYYPSPHHQAQFYALAQETGSTDAQRGSIGLNSLADGELGERPQYPIPTIIKCAILGSPHQQLTLAELYIAMERRFDYYRDSDRKKPWRNSVRHNLSLNNQFDKKERPITEPGKGNYWVVVPDMPQGNKRERKRNKKPGKRALAAAAVTADAERLAHGQKNGEASTSSGHTEMPPGPHSAPPAAAYPPPIRGYTIGTLPANAGSYAAVTGALPDPPPLDRHLFRPWGGDTSPHDPGRTASEKQDVQPSTSIAHKNDHAHCRSPARVVPEIRSAQPQFGEPSLRPATGFASPASRPEATAHIHRVTESVSTASSSSNSSVHGPHDSPTTWSRHQYDKIGPVPTAPQNAFAELSAQIEREWTGATGSGGPALAARKKRRRRKDRATDDESDSEDDGPSDDDEYLPRKRRCKRR